jgi:hypothetical protein
MCLPCAGEPLRALDISAEWRIEFLAWFANVPRNDRAHAPYQEFANAHGPTLTWLQQFSVRTFTSYFSSFLNIWRQCNSCLILFVHVDYLADDADQETVHRFFEAYLLWLFGFVLFCSLQGDCRAYTPGTAWKEADRLLVEFPCTPTRTRAM